MAKEDWALAGLLVVILGAALYAVNTVAELAAQITTAAIGLGGSVVLAVLKHSMDAAKTRDQDLRLEKQRNYQKLLVAIGGFVRSRCQSHDPFTIAHIESCVFGDNEVVTATNRLMPNANDETLKRLLSCLRASVGLPELELQCYDAKRFSRKRGGTHCRRLTDRLVRSRGGNLLPRELS